MPKRKYWQYINDKKPCVKRTISPQPDNINSNTKRKTNSLEDHENPYSIDMIYNYPETN